MPVSRYFKGRGSEVMADMQSRYGAKKGESVFYATANKKGMKPKSKSDGSDRPSIKVLGR